MSKIIYQCLDCGKKHKTEEAAQNCHEAPIQKIETGITRFSKRKGLIGN
ncbi:MAG: hypothetical protein ABR986_08305 [Methanomassiliicoccales archaeon]|jgi:hypothetical protein